MEATAAGQDIHQYSVEPLSKEAGESESAALERILSQHVKRGWEIVDSCGDEVRMPVLIFQKLRANAPQPEYKVEQVPHIKGHDDIDDVRDVIWQQKEEGWVPVCVMDSPITSPVAVYRKASRPVDKLFLKVIEVSPAIMEKVEEAIVNELLDQQVRDNLALACVMHGGLNPVLVLMTKDDDRPFEYLVEHAKGGIFKNQTTKLTELIESRAKEGWQVCGSFEDAFFWPCVIFRRATEEMPVTTKEIEEEVLNDQAQRNKAG